MQPRSRPTRHLGRKVFVIGASLLDHILAFLLLIVLPARALWRDWVPPKTQTSNTSRYLTTIAMVGGLLVLLASSWLVTTRPIAALGLAPPLTMPALIGLTISMTFIATLIPVIMRRKSASGSTDMKGAGQILLPETPREIRLFVLFALVVGFGWEVLYRGFLLIYLQPHVGLVAAVIASAVTYGAAHGFKSLAQFAGSIVAAFAFTLGYVLTDNLWWLIILHASLPLMGLLTSRSPSLKVARDVGDLA